jgi:hypothetical protein
MSGIDDQIDTFELLNKEIADRLARLAASGNQLDTKSALLAGAAATATQFLATRPSPQPVLAVLAFIAFGGAFFFALTAYVATRHYDVPEPDALLSFTDKSRAEVLARLVATRVAAFMRNHRRHRRKAVLWWCSVGLLSAGLIFSTVAIVQNGSHDRAPVEQPAATAK